MVLASIDITSRLSLHWPRAYYGRCTANPTLGKMCSKFYQQEIVLGGRSLTLPVGDHAGATSLALRFPRAAIVINATELFDEAIVFDFERGCLIVK